MKLTPKPASKANSKSQGATSTPPNDKDSYSTEKRPRPSVNKENLVLTGVTYTGVDSQGTAVDTEYQKQEKNSEDTNSSCLVISTTDLTPQEITEWRNIGVLMAQMKWLTLYSDCKPFSEGVRSGEGVINAVGLVDDYEKVVLYKAKGTFAGEPVTVEMNDPAHLYSFAGAAAKDLYRRGILR